MDYKEEIAFLDEFETEDQSEREQLKDDEIGKIKDTYKNIPADYLDYLKYVGWGDFMDCAFMVFRRPMKLSEITGGNEEYDHLLFFGDNFAGDHSGFNLNKNDKVIVWWHDVDEIHETEQTFYEYIREQIM